MQLERKALYNLLRMNWLRDPEIDVAEWQVLDYRQITAEDIQRRLKHLGIDSSIDTIVSYIDQFDSPEELTDEFLLGDEEMEAANEDQVYLLVFEIWRRYRPENRCLSILCDELDYRINEFDLDQLDDDEQMQDVLANLALLLDSGTDQGADPIELFESIASGCANDLESFLYDYIAEKIDEDDTAYASELVETFYDYITDVKWFDFLRARILMESDAEAANESLQQIFDESSDDAEFGLDEEILAALVPGGHKDLFEAVLKRAAAHVETEEDFQDLLNITIDFFNCLDCEAEEQAISKILEGRAKKDGEVAIQSNDPDIAKLLKITQSARPPS